ncbi:GNAT family N-acetyltransferase [Paeniglutamicibacter gangotriensis]|uniref:N-acetyltransferase domain-containing protein n=2 Tax=Paeniglutamicibacter gangotriensis TaxID=254787 RepID=M7NPP4_9MICC|nr:GNAT family N-acetyltransferase [Paeniglutamicibacter gangotriensis]EMR00499.1 hypothetical protein ADIAG_00506 [Paeniglutamicibacter gangotriensis Lz1y]KAA0975930.1 GNAT family N-acetyltransferase [Paeniglutamicibacter gangotriensis]
MTDDDRTSFASGAPELDRWFQRSALESQRANRAVTYVATDGQSIIGYYSIVVSAVEKAETPAKFGKPSDPRLIPCILLARLAVSQQHQGMGVGAGLFKDALERSAFLSESVAAQAMLIHAREEAAKAFYKNLAECFELPGNPLHLMIPMKWIRSNFLP